MILFGDRFKSNTSCKGQVCLLLLPVLFGGIHEGRAKAELVISQYPPLCLPPPTPLLIPFTRAGAPSIIGGALMGRCFAKPLNSPQQYTSPSSAEPIICCIMWNFKDVF